MKKNHDLGTFPLNQSVNGNLDKMHGAKSLKFHTLLIARYVTLKFHLYKLVC